MFFRDYFAIVEGDQPTIIAKIYGVYSVESMCRNVQYFVLMENLFHETFGGDVMMIFDLKGASVNR